MARTGHTPESAKTMSIIVDMWIKASLAFVVAIAFIAILVKILCFMDPKDWESLTVLSLLEAFFAGTIYRPFSHYFYKRDRKESPEEE